jgi:hypothetical protein
MSDWGSHYSYLIIGLLTLFWAVLSTYRGKTRSRFSGWVYRAKEPGGFWFAVAVYYVAGVLFIGLFLNGVYGPSR